MKNLLAPFLKRLFGEEKGQAAYLMGLGMFAIMGMGGLTVDVGHAYLVRTELQAAANASALAATPALYDGGSTSSSPSTSLVKLAQEYDASPASLNTAYGANGYNYDPSMGSVTTTITAPCLNSQLVGVTSCSASNWNNQSNSVRINESVNMPTYFMRIFGINSLNMSATATALPKGQTKPFNVAIILDSTPSMVNTDPNCNGKTYEQCGLAAVESMLSAINPCLNQSSTGCTAASSSNVAAVRISIFTFPNVLTTNVNSTTNVEASCGTPQYAWYTFPKIPPSMITKATGYNFGYTPVTYSKSGGTTYTATYQITPPSTSPATADPDQFGFSSDFFPGSNGEKMKTSSTLVKVVGNESASGSGITAGCLTPPPNAQYSGGTFGASTTGLATDFAPVIYAAQAALQAEKAQADPLIHSILPGVDSTNLIIFVSDGQATASAARFPALGYSATTTASGGYGTGVGGINISNAFSSNASTGKNLAGGAWGTYPDVNNECQQAIAAAQYAISQGTKVIGVAYGSEANGCFTGDSQVGFDQSAHITLSPATAPPLGAAITGWFAPCVTVQDMADTAAQDPTSTVPDFYVETGSQGCNISGAGKPMANLATIFKYYILGTLMPAPRLVPNSIS